MIEHPCTFQQMQFCQAHVRNGGHDTYRNFTEEDAFSFSQLKDSVQLPNEPTLRFYADGEEHSDWDDGYEPPGSA